MVKLARVCAGVERVDIGLPRYQPSRTKEARERRQVLRNNKKDVDLERACRLRTCELTSLQHHHYFTVQMNGLISLLPPRPTS